MLTLEQRTTLVGDAREHVLMGAHKVLGKRTDDALEVMGSVLLTMWERPPAKLPKHPERWAYRAGVHRAIDLRRKEQLRARHGVPTRAPGGEESWVDVAPGEQPRGELTPEVAATMSAAIARLPEGERAAVRLELHGMTRREVASQLGVGLGALRVRLTRARTKLRADPELGAAWADALLDEVGR